MKLISMTDFVLSQKVRGMEVQSLGHQYQERARRFYLIQNYANFLKQPLTLGMFVPCDEDGNVLEEPREDDYSFYTHNNKSVHEEYNEAKESVLFDGFVFENNVLISGDKRVSMSLLIFSREYPKYNVESLITDKCFGYDYTLTSSALKQIGI